MRWRVPEVALVLSDRAVALARRTGDQATRLSAEALAVFAGNRLGRGVAATPRALAAVRDAESFGDPEVLTFLRVELAWCASGAGSHEVALRILRAELERERVDPAVRAHALLAMAAALPARRDMDQRTEVLDEAERLYANCSSNRDVTGLLTARVWAARAAHRRRLSEFDAAVAAADAGLDLLSALTDPEADSGEIRARLVLERAQALLDLGRRGEAVQAAQSELARPVRAAAAGPLGWLGLAVATRVHLPEGDYPSAVRVLAETAAIAERHELDGLRAEALNVLSRAHESVGDTEAALRTLRDAYAADRRWRSSTHQSRMSLLTEFPPHTGKPARALAPVTPVDAAAERPRRRRHAGPDAAEPGETPAAQSVSLAEAAQPVAAQPVSRGKRRREESIEPDWSAFLGLAEDREQPSAEPEPAPEPEPEPVVEEQAEGQASAEEAEFAAVEQEIAGLSGYSDTHDAARRLLASLTAHAEQEPDETAEAAVDELPEPRVEFAGLSDRPPWQTDSDESGEVEDARADDPLTAAADSLRWITSGGAHHDEPDEGPVVEQDQPEPAGEPRTTARSLLEQVGINLASYGVSEPDPDPDQSVPAEPVEQEEPTGRRSRGKSLAELRAELQLPENHTPSRRRRYAEPDTVETPAPAEPEAPKAEPEPSSDAGLADLLAEAMRAYEAGRYDDIPDLRGEA